jgi:hypothetical protein
MDLKSKKNLYKMVKDGVRNLDEVFVWVDNEHELTKLVLSGSQIIRDELK